MKYYRSNSYINYGAIPSNEYAKNKNDRMSEYDIEMEKSINLDDEAARKATRSLRLFQTKPNSGSNRSVNELGWRTNGSSMDMLQQFVDYEPISIT